MKTLIWLDLADVPYNNSVNPSPHSHFPPRPSPGTPLNEIHYHLTKTPEDHEPTSQQVDFSRITVRQFKSVIVELIREAQSGLHVPLLSMADTWDNCKAVEWTYVVTEKDTDVKTHMWQTKARGTDGIQDLFEVLKVFGTTARVTVSLKMDVPKVPACRLHLDPHPWIQIRPFEVVTAPPSTPSTVFDHPRPCEFTLAEFLQFCYIPPDDIDVWDVLHTHRIHHWTALKGVNERELRDLGFAFGTTRLVLSGIFRAEGLVAL